MAQGCGATSKAWSPAQPEAHGLCLQEARLGWPWRARGCRDEASVQGGWGARLGSPGCQSLPRTPDDTATCLCAIHTALDQPCPCSLQQGCPARGRDTAGGQQGCGDALWSMARDRKPFVVTRGCHQTHTRRASCLSDPSCCCVTSDWATGSLTAATRPSQLPLQSGSPGLALPDKAAWAGAQHHLWNE